MTNARPGGLTRRRFLQVLGTVGGAGAVLATMEAFDLVPSAREHTTPFQPPPGDSSIRTVRAGVSSSGSSAGAIGAGGHAVRDRG